METDYKVKTAVFEGPLPLLYDLIEKKKLAISDISLAAVTEDFISYLRSLGEMPLHYVTNFIITAAAPVPIKSKSLLPDLSPTAEEEASTDVLQKRLSLYRVFRETAAKIPSFLGNP